MNGLREIEVAHLVLIHSIPLTVLGHSLAGFEICSRHFICQSFDGYIFNEYSIPHVDVRKSISGH